MVTVSRRSAALAPRRRVEIRFARARWCEAAVLLEVVLALVLFVAAAAVITGGMNSSVDSVERQRLNLHAVDRAVSVMSELQMGLRTTEAVGPEPFEPPFEQWTWQLNLAPAGNDETDAGGLTQVEVVIRHEEAPVVFRLTQTVRLAGGEALPAAVPELVTP